MNSSKEVIEDEFKPKYIYSFTHSYEEVTISVKADYQDEAENLLNSLVLITTDWSLADREEIVYETENIE
jgi:hypothetical protein